jgi:hypothetical protein
MWWERGFPDSLVPAQQGRMNIPLISERKQAVPSGPVAADGVRGILGAYVDSLKFAELDLGLVHLGHIEPQLCHMAGTCGIFGLCWAMISRWRAIQGRFDYSMSLGGSQCITLHHLSVGTGAHEDVPERKPVLAGKHIRSEISWERPALGCSSTSGERHA